MRSRLILTKGLSPIPVVIFICSSIITTEAWAKSKNVPKALQSSVSSVYLPLEGAEDCKISPNTEISGTCHLNFDGEDEGIAGEAQTLVEWSLDGPFAQVIEACKKNIEKFQATYVSTPPDFERTYFMLDEGSKKYCTSIVDKEQEPLVEPPPHQDHDHSPVAPPVHEE